MSEPIDLDAALATALLAAGADPCPACARPLAATRVYMVSKRPPCACWDFATGQRVVIDMPDDGTIDEEGLAAMHEERRR